MKTRNRIFYIRHSPYKVWGKREEIIWKVEKNLYERRQRFKTRERSLIDGNSIGAWLRHRGLDFTE